MGFAYGIIDIRDITTGEDTSQRVASSSRQHSVLRWRGPCIREKRWIFLQMKICTVISQLCMKSGKSLYNFLDIFVCRKHSFFLVAVQEEVTSTHGFIMAMHYGVGILCLQKWPRLMVLLFKFSALPLANLISMLASYNSTQMVAQFHPAGPSSHCLSCGSYI